MINTNTAEILSARYLLKKELMTRQFYQFCSNKPLKDKPYLRFDIPNFKLYGPVYRTLNKKWDY